MRGAPCAGPVVPPGGYRRTRPGATVLLAVFHHDRTARPAHGGGRRPDVVSPVASVRRQVHAEVLYTGGHRRALLALCRHCLDLSVPAALSDRGSPTLTCKNTWIRSRSTLLFFCRCCF